MNYLHMQLHSLQRQFPNVPLAALKAAMVEGIEAFSWMKDGVSYVGTCGTLKRDAVKDVMEYE